MDEMYKFLVGEVRANCLGLFSEASNNVVVDHAVMPKCLDSGCSLTTTFGLLYWLVRGICG